MVVAMPLTVARVLALQIFAIAFALTALSDAHAANPVRVNPVETFVQGSVDKRYAILNDSALSFAAVDSPFRWGPSSDRSAGERRSDAVLFWCQ